MVPRPPFVFGLRRSALSLDYAPCPLRDRCCPRYSGRAGGWLAGLGLLRPCTALRSPCRPFRRAPPAQRLGRPLGSGATAPASRPAPHPGGFTRAGPAPGPGRLVPPPAGLRRPGLPPAPGRTPHATARPRSAAALPAAHRLPPPPAPSTAAA